MYNHLKHYKAIFVNIVLLAFLACDTPLIIDVPASKEIDYSKYILPEIEVDYLKAAVGRRLFFFEEDSVSCSTCHLSEKGFTAGKQQSKGKGDDLPPIKSPSSMSIVGSRMLLWNGAASPDESNFPFNEGELKENNWYGSTALVHQALFAQIAHEQTFTRDSVMNDTMIMNLLKLAYPGVKESKLCDELDIAECLAAFQSTLVPYNSRQQQYLRGEIYLTDEEMQGWELFDQNCQSCHNAPWLGADRFTKTTTPPFINEIHDGSAPQNLGRYSLTGYPEDKGKFIIMRLQTNVIKHGVWGFSGESSDLNEFVLNHMSRSKLTHEEVSDIVSFLASLHDKDLELIGSEFTK